MKVSVRNVMLLSAIAASLAVSVNQKDGAVQGQTAMLESSDQWIGGWFKNEKKNNKALDTANQDEADYSSQIQGDTLDLNRMLEAATSEYNDAVEARKAAHDEAEKDPSTYKKVTELKKKEVALKKKELEIRFAIVLSKEARAAVISADNLVGDKVRSANTWGRQFDNYSKAATKIASLITKARDQQTVGMAQKYYHEANQAAKAALKAFEESEPAANSLLSFRKSFPAFKTKTLRDVQVKHIAENKFSVSQAEFRLEAYEKNLKEAKEEESSGDFKAALGDYEDAEQAVTDAMSETGLLSKDYQGAQHIALYAFEHTMLNVALNNLDATLAVVENRLVMSKKYRDSLSATLRAQIAFLDRAAVEQQIDKSLYQTAWSLTEQTVSLQKALGEYAPLKETKKASYKEHQERLLRITQALVDTKGDVRELAKAANGQKKQKKSIGSFVEIGESDLNARF